MCQKLTHASQQNDVLEFLVLHSSNASAPRIIPGGISSPSALAVLRLTTISSLVGCSTGRSAGFTPLRISRHSARLLNRAILCLVRYGAPESTKTIDGRPPQLAASCEPLTAAHPHGAVSWCPRSWEARRAP